MGSKENQYPPKKVATEVRLQFKVEVRFLGVCDIAIDGSSLDHFPMNNGDSPAPPSVVAACPDRDHPLGPLGPAPAEEPGPHLQP